MNQWKQISLGAVALFAVLLVVGCGSPVGDNSGDDGNGDDGNGDGEPTYLPVSGLTATVGDEELTLQWSDPTDAGLEEIQITWNPGGSDVQTVDPGAESYTAGGLTNDTTYTFSVVAGYATGNTSTAKTVSATPRTLIDPFDYMFNTSGHVLRSPPTGDIQKFRDNDTTNTFWYIKNPNPDFGWRWERYRYDDEYIWLERDTTWPHMDNGGYRAYDALNWESMKLAPARNWWVGAVLPFDTYIRGFDFEPPDYNTVTDIKEEDTHWPAQRELVYHNDALDTTQHFRDGSELGTIDVIVIETKVRPDIPFRPTKVERHWYARGYGWVRWQHWTNETEDPDFHDILAATPIEEAWDVRFTELKESTYGPEFQDVCPGYQPTR